MSKLGECLLKGGKAFDPAEQQELFAMAAQIQADAENGVDEQEAARLAVQQVLGDATAERASFMEQITKQLGDRQPFQFSGAETQIDGVGMKPNALGLVSQLEYGVRNNSVQGWEKSKRNPEGRARGADILRDLKWTRSRMDGKTKEPMAKDELEWSGLKELLGRDPNARFTRQEVLDFLSGNSLTVEETVAPWDENDPERDPMESGEGVSWGETEYLDNTEEIEERAQNYVTDWEEDPALVPWIEDYVKVEIESLLDDNPEATEEEIAEARRDAAWGMALHESREVADINPPLRVFGERSDGADYVIESEGGGFVLAINGEVLGNYDRFAEAEYAAEEHAEENSGPSLTETDSRWSASGYNADGGYDNYRERKIKLPDVEGEYEHAVHFPNEFNIATFQRVSDRVVETRDPDGEWDSQEAYFIEEQQSDWHTALAKKTGNKNAEVPDAPLQNDGWLKLGLKLALIEVAGDSNYDVLSWADAETLTQRWTTKYRKMFAIQYDQKMPKLIKQLTGIDPIHVPFDKDANQTDGRTGHWYIPMTPELRQQIQQTPFFMYREQQGDTAPAMSAAQRDAILEEGTANLNANSITRQALEGGKLKLLSRYDLYSLVQEDNRWQQVTANSRVLGAYNRATGEAVLLTDSMTQSEDFVPVALHELLHESQDYAAATGDQRLSMLLGDERDGLVQRLQQLENYGSTKEKMLLTRARELFESSSASDKDSNTQADEYLAYVIQAVAENESDASPGLLTWVGDVLAAAMRGLRKVLGLTPTDVSRMSLGQFSRFAMTAMDLRASEPPIRGGSSVAATPEIRAGNAWSTRMEEIEKSDIMESSGNTARPTINNRLRIMERVVARYPQLLGTINRRMLAEIAPKNMTAVKDFVRHAEQMDADRNAILSEAGTLLEDWHRWARANKGAAQKLYDLMHDTTVAGVDPSKVYEPLITEREYLSQKQKYLDKRKNATTPEAREIAQRQLQDLDQTRAEESERKRTQPMLDVRYRALTKDAKRFYKEVRDTYGKQNKQLYAELMKRIERAEMTDNTRRMMQDKLRANFESQKVRGPYFPLMRFGDYWGASRNRATGELVEYRHFDSLSDATAWTDEQTKKGFEANQGAKQDDDFGWGQVDQEYASAVQDMIKQSDSIGAAEKRELADTVWQLYLQTLPDMSIRKQFIHRKKTKGWNDDAMRAYAHLSLHAAHHVTKIRHGDTLTDDVKRGQEQAKQLTNSTYADRIAGELDRHADWALNPTSNEVAQLLNSIGFVGYLSVSPAAAIVNMVQTPQVALPIMGGEFGYDKSVKELGRAAAEFSGLVGANAVSRVKDRQVFLDQSQKKHYDAILKGDEKVAYNELVRRGRFDKTRAHDLAGTADAGMNRNKYISAEQNPLSHIWMDRIAASFHNAEVFNREVTGMAAYRLARAKGMGQAAAIDVADRIVQDAHFDYSNSARPRMLRGPVAKVVGQFKQYSINMTWRLLRDTYVAIGASDLSAQEAKEVRQRVYGMWGMSLFFGGLVGTPIYSMVVGIANTLGEVFGDDDEPVDAAAEFRTGLVDTWGEEWADIIMKGPVDFFSGASVGSRVSSDIWRLWIQNDTQGYEGREAWAQVLMQAAGPVVGGTGSMIFEGVQLAKEGEGYRGSEKILPKFARDILKAGRFTREGVTNMRGDPVMAKDDLNSWELALQAVGFTPARLEKQYSLNRDVKTRATAYQDRRSKLLKKAAGEIMNDGGLTNDTREALASYNAAVPEYAIDVDTIISSIRSRQRASGRSISGVDIPNDALRARVLREIDY